MSAFAYRAGVLHAEGVSLAEIARAVGTPAYVYAQGAIEDAYCTLAASVDAKICYSVKANSNQAVIATLARLGSGADVVSGGELARAVAAGVNPADIVFSGVGKTRREIGQALEAGIGQINAESEAELAVISEVASAAGQTAPVALRVNPDVAVDTHEKIATGGYAHKFGIPVEETPRLYAISHAMPGLRMVGLAVHIGSQIMETAPYEQAFRTLAALVGTLRGDGLPVERLDLGGGLGIPYIEETPPGPDALARVIAGTVGGLGCSLVIEPGRYLVGNAGVLVTGVIHTKQTPTRRFVVVDAAMNDLLRPTLYEARHPVMPVVEPVEAAEALPADIVGPVCETGDVLAKAAPLPALSEGDLIAIGAAGAYGAVMASYYNSRALVGEVMVCAERFAVIRPRQEPAVLQALDRIPPWLAGSG